jgi:predicted nuclease with TOPRIM domain
MENNTKDSNQTIANSPVTTMLDLESLIKRYLKDIGELREDIKEQKQMFDDAFDNDVKFKESDDKAKEINRAKAAVKQIIKRTPAVAELENKINGMKDEMKELQDALSGYVREYQRVSGATQIEGENGEIMEIVHTVKLVKRKK